MKSKKSKNHPKQLTPLLGDIRQMIEQAKSVVAATVNVGLTLLYWKIGERIKREILHNKRADYGEQIVATLSAQLAQEQGGSFAEKNLRRMVQFAEVFHEEKIVVSLIRQLTWTHFIVLIPLKDPLQRDFYSEMCRVERWSVRTLRQKIDGMLFERTALSKKPEKLAKLELAKLRKEDKLSPDLVFKDPYFLDFLGLKGAYLEKDLEAAILRELESFIMEFGSGFSFVARQKRITVGSDDFYIDLLFYHRDLRRLVAIELKLEKFKPEHKGQMELYLRWLDQHERKSGEEHPLGIILCAGKSDEQIELMEMGKSGIRVAEYLTQLPPRKLLVEKLHKAIESVRNRLEQKNKGRTRA